MSTKNAQQPNSNPSAGSAKLLVSRCFSSYEERYDFEKEIVEKILADRQWMSTFKRRQIAEIVVSDFVEMFLQNNG